MALEKIEIKGFKSIKEGAFELRPINIFIGANAAGKSNFISFLTMLHSIVEGKLNYFVAKQARKADSLLFYGRKTTPTIEATITFGQNQYAFSLEPTQANTFIFEREVAYYNPDGDFSNPYEALNRSGNEESCLLTSDQSVCKFILKSLKSWIVYHFHDTGERSPMKQPCRVGDNRTLKPDGSNIAAYLYALKETSPEHYRKLVSLIRMVNPPFDDFVLSPAVLNPDQIELEWKDKAFETTFNAHALSDGTLRFICLATLLIQPSKPETIIIDEPELGLHPYAITILASLLQSASTESQIIVSTQSVTFVDHFLAEDIVVVDKKDNASTFKRLNEESLEVWLEEYSLGELWEKNILGGRP